VSAIRGESMLSFEVQRVTDFTMTTVEITEQNFWNLPADVREMLRVYARELPMRSDGKVAFEMASHRWPEIEARMRAIEEKRA
jgi:hypothetical protein